MINYITEENFVNIDSEVLLDPKWYQDVEDMVVSIDAAATPDYAREFVLPMRDKLAEAGDQMPKELFKKYIRLFKTLLLCSVPSMKDVEKERFFRENILDVFYLDFIDVKNEVEINFRSYFKDQQIIEQTRQIFLRGLEKNQELLGMENIITTMSGEDKQVKPTVQNWLVDYNSSVHMDPGTHRRSGFEQTNYILHSLNVQKLSKEDKQALQKIIQFYDWLKFDPLRYDYRLPDQPIWEDSILDIPKDRAEKLIPDEIREMISKMREEKAAQGEVVAETDYMKAEKFVMQTADINADQQRGSDADLDVEKNYHNIASIQPPVVPQRKNKPEVREMITIQEEQAPAAKAAPVTQQPKPNLPPGVDSLDTLLAKERNKSARSVNIQDLLSKRQASEDHRGLKMAPVPVAEAPVRGAGDGERVISNSQQKIKPEAVEKSKVDIDKKLEELRNKSKLKN